MAIAPLGPIRTISPVAAPGIAPAAVAAPTATSTNAAARTAAVQAATGAQKLFDFPGFAAGDTFKLAKGSKVSIAGIKGDAIIEKLQDDSAQFRIRGKAALFLNVDAQVKLDLIGDNLVRLHAAGKGVPELNANGRITETRTNFLRVAPIEMRVRDTVIDRVSDDRIIIDFEHPTMGVAHLILDRQVRA